MAELQLRLAECRLEMEPTKTKIVYCKDGSRKGRHANQAFDFLGYRFRPRLVKNSKRGQPVLELLERDNLGETPHCLVWGFLCQRDSLRKFWQRSVPSEAAGRLHACQLRQVEIADHA
jgi:hypothetical protein